MSRTALQAWHPCGETPTTHSLFVMRGLDPRIHDEGQRAVTYVYSSPCVIMDCRVKPGNDHLSITPPCAQYGFDRHARPRRRPLAERRIRCMHLAGDGTLAGEFAKHVVRLLARGHN